MSERSLIADQSGPESPRAASTRAQILAAAARVLREYGVVGMTTRAIARQAGIADGTLYTHFLHKEDLILATIEAELPRLALGALDADTRSLQASLEALVRAGLHYATTLVLLSGALFFDPDLLTRIRTGLVERNPSPLELYRRVSESIVREQHRGRIKARLDPLGVAALLLGPCFQYAFERHLVGSQALAQSEDQFVADLAQTLVACVARRRARKAARQEAREQSERLP